MLTSFWNIRQPSGMDEREIDEIAAWLAQEKVCFMVYFIFSFIFGSFSSLVLIPMYIFTNCTDPR